MSQKGNITLWIVGAIGVVLVLAASLGVRYAVENVQRVQKQTQLSYPTEQQEVSKETAKDEIVTWNSYTYSSVESKILPDITFKYPAVFGNNPTLISSRNTNRPENISGDWGGFVEFNPKGAFGDDSMRIEFFKRTNSETNFENYVTKYATSGGWASTKYFKAGIYKVARLRFVSPSHYDADVGWYLVELPSKNILAISTSGDKKYLYDDDQSGFSTRDKIIMTMELAPISQPPFPQQPISSGMETYENVLYTVRYQKDNFSIEDSFAPQVVDIKSNSYPEFSFRIIVSPGKYNSDNELKNDISAGVGLKVDELNLGNKKFFRHYSQPGSTYYTRNQRTGNVMSFTVYDPTGALKQEIDAMLSSFEFK